MDGAAALREQFKHLLSEDLGSPARADHRTEQAAPLPPQAATQQPFSIRKVIPFIFVGIVAIVAAFAYTNRQDLFDFCRSTNYTVPPERQRDDETETEEDEPAGISNDPMFEPL